MKSASLHWNLFSTYRQLPSRFFSEGRLADFPAPQLLRFNAPLARELGLLPGGTVNGPDDTDMSAGIADILSGNRFPEGSQPLSQAYAGHQFGHFSMLGDGRATLIGEQLTPAGELIDIQLKGNGRTPYSRSGDGKAALGPMLREYLISEAMHALGIPTTRSLAVVTTGERIYRGHLLRGAVLTRTARSHIRVATFQFAAAAGDANADVRALADYVIARHFPDIPDRSGNPYRLLLEAVIERQIQLVARWQWVGFIHGVMNTDNMAVAGETIDYGPCAFMDTYHPETVFSSIDHQGRYRYDRQPAIALWNLARLAETLLPLLADDQDEALQVASETLQSFGKRFDEVYTAGMARKLGLHTLPESRPDEQDRLLLADLLQLMQKHEADYTNTFVRLTLETAGRDGHGLEGTAALFNAESWQAWKNRWSDRLNRQAQGQAAAAELMMKSNPVVIPRNEQVEAALDAAVDGDMQRFDALAAVLQHPFDYDATIPAEFQKVPVNSSGYRTFCGT